MKSTMSATRILELALWTASAATICIAVWSASWSPHPLSERNSDERAPALRAPADARALGRMRARVVKNDPFRLARHASPVAFTIAAEQEPVAIATSVRPQKPMLVLRGIVGGPPWEAVLEGIPGRDRGVVVRSGDIIHSPAANNHLPSASVNWLGSTLRVRQVSVDGVVVSGMDTTWLLRLGSNAARTKRAP